MQLISGSFPGSQMYDNIDGIKIMRVGGKYFLYPQTILRYLTSLRGKYDIIIDEINTIPFLSALYSREPHVAFIHQLAANVLYEELPIGIAKILSFLEPHVLRIYRNTPIFTSQSTKEDLISIGIDRSNLHVINYGVNHNIYHLGKTKSSYPHVFYLGRLKRFKGVHLLIEAMSQVLKEIPEARLTIAGSGDLDYQNNLKKLTAELGLSKNVVFYEFGMGDSLVQKVKIMQEAWVLVFPSAREGFGLVVVEANACGTPTIATNVPGLRETVQNNDTGFLVARNTHALASSIKRVLCDSELRTKLSKNAFEWSMRFNWDETAEGMLKVLEETIKNKSKSVSEN